jgi:drug/metabolite transporter (DMT)-like permease
MRSWRAVLLSPQLFIIYSILFGSANNVIGRAVVEEVAPLTLSFIRFAIAALALAPIGVPALIRQRAVFLGRWKLMIAMSIVGIAIYNPTVYYGLLSTTAVNASLISAAMPVLSLALAWLFFRERATWLRGLGIAVSLGGVLLTVSRGDPAVLATFAINPGDLLVMVGVLSWCVFTVNLRRVPPVDPFAFMQVTMIVGLLAQLPFFVIEAVSVPPPVLDRDNVLAILYLGIFAATVSYYCWNRGVAGLGATVASQFAYLSPIYSSLLAIAFLGESFHLYHAASIALIFVGIFLSTRRAAAAKPPTTPT